MQGKRYLDVGCAERIHPEFINLDYEWNSKIDLCWDATTRLPLPGGSLRGIFSEHCLEHIPVHRLGLMLDEWHRLLEPGGTVRIVVPDGELYLRTYLQRQGCGEQFPSFPYENDDAVNGVYTPMLSVNRIFYEWGHCFIFDFTTLAAFLEKHGFTDIRRVSLGCGRDKTLLIDSPWREVESLYVEATRP